MQSIDEDNKLRYWSGSECKVSSNKATDKYVAFAIKEVTMTEVCKKVGYEVKIVKEK